MQSSTRVLPLVADAREGLAELDSALTGYRAPTDVAAPRPTRRPHGTGRRRCHCAFERSASLGRAGDRSGAARHASGCDHRLCRRRPAGRTAQTVAGAPDRDLSPGIRLFLHGYEIAGGLGVKLARPDREVIVLVGDGSYLMLNSEIATSVTLGLKLTIVLLDNGGFGCIDRLQRAPGGAAFNNLLADCGAAPPIDFQAHAASLGALSERAESLSELEAACSAPTLPTGPA